MINLADNKKDTGIFVKKIRFGVSVHKSNVSGLLNVGLNLYGDELNSSVSRNTKP